MKVLHFPYSRHGRRGFTLIELLVVIALIALLAAILFPIFGRARAAASKAVGISNMRQIGTGTMMYVQDYDEHYPYYKWDMMVCKELVVTGNPGQLSYRDPAYFHHTQAAWCNALQPYIKNLGIFQDPGDRTRQRPDHCIYFPLERYSPTVGPEVSTYISYGWNEYASGKSYAAYQNPAQDLMWSDDAGLVLVDTWDRFTWTDDLYVRRAIWNDLTWGTHCGLSPDPRASAVPGSVAITQWECLKKGIRHETGTNVAFMDGHAKFVHSRNLREVGPDNGQIIPGPGSVIPRY